MTNVWKKSNRTLTFWHDDGDPSRMYSGPLVIFAGNKPGQQPAGLYYPPGQYNVIDLRALGIPGFPANVVSCVLQGMLIITEASLSTIDDLVCGVRPKGSTFDAAGNYQMQAMAALNGDGDRKPQSVRCSVVDGCIELFWQGYYKIGSANVPFSQRTDFTTGFLVNLSLVEVNYWEDEGSNPSPEPAPDQVIKVPLAGLNIRFEQE